MIKINFLRDFKRRELKEGGEGASVTSTFGSVFGNTQLASDEESSSIRKEAFKNLFLASIGVIGLYSYESYRIPELQSQVRYYNSRLDELSQKNQLAAQAVDQTRKLKKEQELIQKQIQAIDNLKKGRERFFEVLDLLQRTIPQSLWLTQIDWAEDKVLMSGFATNDLDISTFMDGLSKNVMFQRVDLLRSEEDARSKARLKKFELEALLEGKI